ncbi:MAG: CBS domain-containing protein [Archangium sp.]|nr:CBS domain-containing protein [Archangium sp.]
MQDTIERFMTPAVHTIGSDRTLAEAHALMRQYRVRHLPVLTRGKLVGLVTERDLALVETLKNTDPTKVSVDDAMSRDVFSVEPSAPLASVARTMAHERLGSVVVMSDAKVVGIFTAVDALKALDLLLSSPPVQLALRQALVPATTGQPS